MLTWEKPHARHLGYIEASIEMYAQITLLSPFPRSGAHSLPPIISMSKPLSNEFAPNCERCEMRLTADVEALHDFA